MRRILFEECCVKLISLALPPRYSTLRMLQNAVNKLFSLMFRSGHCLHTLLPDLKMIGIVLCSSGNSFNLSQCNYKL